MKVWGVGGVSWKRVLGHGRVASAGRPESRQHSGTSAGDSLQPQPGAVRHGPGRESVTPDWQGDEACCRGTASQTLQAPPRVLVTRTCALGLLCWVLHVHWCSGAMQGTLGSFSQGNGAAAADQECYKEPEKGVEKALLDDGCGRLETREACWMRSFFPGSVRRK